MSDYSPFITLEEADAEAAKGGRLMDEARAWIDANPEAWAYIESQALKSARRRRPFGMKALCEHVRWHMQVDVGLGEFKLNNNHTSAFTRILIARHPEVEPYVRQRSSACDLSA